MSTVKRVSGEYTIQSIGASDPINLISPSVNIEGNLTVTGNAVLVGNINADKIFNGTTSIEIPVTNGNANVTVGGTSNVAVFATTGQYVTGVVSASGNVDGGNLRTAGQVSATGNISGGNLTVATGNIVLTQTSGATTSQMIRFQDANATVTTLGANIGAIEWYTSDSTTPGARVTARIQAVYEDAAGNANIQIQTGPTTTPTTRITVIGSSGNVGIANAAPLHNLAVTGTVYGSSTLTAVGNITGGNISTAGLVTATGNVTGGNLITGGLATVTGNITGGNVISVGAVSAGAAGISATGNITGGNLLSNGLISATANITGANVVATQNVYTTGNVLANVVSATANITGANINITGNSYGTGIGVENIVWQSTDATVSSVTPVPAGVLTFNALANQAYKFDAYIPVTPSGSMTTGFSVNFAAGTCQYTVESPTASNSAFTAVYTSSVSNAMSSTASMTGTDLRAVRITGTFYHTGNTTVTINAQNSTGTLTIKTGSNLSYTRIG